MNTMMTRRRTPALLGLVAALLVFSGCPLSPDSGDPPDDDDDRVPERNTVAGAIALYSFAWQQEDYDLYEQLLHDSFEYFPQEDDFDDLPWIEGDSWGRTDELNMAANMFDDSFVPTDPGQDAVDSITMSVAIQNERSVPEGVEVTGTADITVLWAENTGATSEVRFIFTVVPDPDEPGLFQIVKQQEESLF